jgi:3-hydroxyisobutyrate dehydrogenase
VEVGLIGTGLMGLPMAQRLLNAGIAPIVYNRTTEKLASLKAAGIATAPSVSELIRACQCIILMVTNAAAIREVLLSPEAQRELAGKTIIQMGTIAPMESQAIATEVNAAGAEYLEAPVLGSISEAEAGKLIVMVGSSPEQFEAWRGLLQHFGADPMWVGSVGAAAALKLALNQLIGSLTSAFASSLGFVIRQGIEVELFMKILRGSALYAPTFDKKLQRMVDRNFDHPNFPTKHLLKDMRLFLNAAEQTGLDTDGVEGVATILERTISLSLADADYSSLYAAVNPEA